MTENEWLDCADPRDLLVCLEEKTSERKARLYTCGLGRCAWPFLGDDRSRNVVDIAEKYADGLVTSLELQVVWKAALDARQGAASYIAAYTGDRGPWQAARMAVIAIQLAKREATTAKDWSTNLSARSRRLLHCVFRNPFREIAMEPAWLAWHDGTIPQIAQTIYDHRTFNDLPILADALEEAGCNNADILAHCRSGGEHVRGCWVVDLLLGKV